MFIKGEIQGQSLGIDVDVFTDEGKSIKDGEKGELVVKKPFPSMPVKFWGDEDGQKYLKLTFQDLKIFGIMVILLKELIIMDLLCVEGLMPHLILEA